MVRRTTLGQLLRENPPRTTTAPSIRLSSDLCVVCGSPSAIAGDGSRSACWPCIYRVGHLVRHPECVTDGTMIMLLEAHGDVVELKRETKAGAIERWHWIEA